jgi:hypothetical protein
MRHLVPSLLTVVLLLSACKKDDDQAGPAPSGPAEPRLVLKFRFDSTQVRLNNIGQPSGVPGGHGAQSPRFNTMSAHYVEFAPFPLTPLGDGDVVYHAPETTAGGANAIDHAQGIQVGEGGTFLSIPLSQLSPGTYPWLRVSLAYQNYDVRLRVNTPVQMDLSGTVASFIGYNTYLTSFLVDQQSVVVNDDRLQGFWAFEVNDPPFPLEPIVGQAPEGATTVPNPMVGSPIPAGSCVVTGPFAAPLTITGAETEDVVITVSLSTNKSFEWEETDGDNIWEPLEGELVRDMGVRGMVPIVE